MLSDPSKKSNYLLRVQVDKYVMVFMYGMSIRIRLFPSALKVFATNETSVNVHVRKADGAKLLEVEVQYSPVYLLRPSRS